RPADQPRSRHRQRRRRRRRLGRGAWLLRRAPPRRNRLGLRHLPRHRGDPLLRGGPLDLVAATDPLDADTDGGLLPDGWERAHGLHPADPSDGLADHDGDGLDRGMEYLLGTSPWLADSDGDSFDDGEEVLMGSDPLDPLD